MFFLVLAILEIAVWTVALRVAHAPEQSENHGIF